MSKSGSVRFDEQAYRAHQQRALGGWHSATVAPLGVDTTNAEDKVPWQHDVDIAHPYERDIQAACLDALKLHPAVAWAARFNTGGARYPDGKGGEQFVRFAFSGCADILGQMKDGRFLAVECKRKYEQPTVDQVAFLMKVQRNRGIAFVARSVDDVVRALRT